MKINKVAYCGMTLNDLRAALVDVSAPLCGISEKSGSLALYFEAENGNADALLLTARPDAEKGAALDVVYCPDLDAVADAESASEDAEEAPDVRKLYPDPDALTAYYSTLNGLCTIKNDSTGGVVPGGPYPVDLVIAWWPGIKFADDPADGEDAEDSSL